jgi:hypothetical protein
MVKRTLRYASTDGYGCETTNLASKVRFLLGALEVRKHMSYFSQSFKKDKIKLYGPEYEQLAWDIRVKSIAVSYDYTAYGHELYTAFLHAPYKISIPINPQYLHNPHFEHAMHQEIHGKLEVLWEDLTEKAGCPLDVFGYPAPKMPAPIDLPTMLAGDEYGHMVINQNMVDMNENQLRQYWEMQLKGFKAKHKIANFDNWLPVDQVADYQSHQDVGTIVQNNLHRLVPGLRATVKCPVCKTHTDSLAKMIIHLNDKYSWSRNQVADWIESLDVDTTVKELE